MRGFKVLLCATALLTSLALVSPALVPAAEAQIGIGINMDVPPVCSYGYYDYAPYACAPGGFYGPGYFYNGIFLGVGPWSNWGYGHGWGGHRFLHAGGGRYVHGAGGGFAAGRGGVAAGRGNAGVASRGRVGGGAAPANRGGFGGGQAAHANAGHASPAAHAAGG